MAVVDDLVRRGAAVLAVFHDVAAMRRHATEVVLLDDGVIDVGRATEAEAMSA